MTKLLSPGRCKSRPPGRPQNFDRHGLAAVLARAFPAVPLELHPSTEPDEIARAQRADVRAALGRLGPDVAAIAEAVLLCPWSVRRRLAEIGLEVDEPVRQPRGPRGAKIELVLADLAANGPSSCCAIGRRIGTDASNVFRACCRMLASGAVVVAGPRRKGGRASFALPPGRSA